MTSVPTATLLIAIVALGCQRTPAASRAEPTLAAELGDALARIRFVEQVEGASFFPAAGPLDLSIAVEDDGATHREQLAIRTPDGAWRRLGPVAAAIRNPSVAPGGGWVVFESNSESFRDLYRVDTASGATRRLTRDGDGAFDPSVAPDGSRVAFVSTVTGEPTLHAMDADGRHRTLLVDIAGQAHTPRWSPDGASIAFAGDRDGPERLFVLDPSTGRVDRVTELDRADRHEGDPVWSPDSTRIAYVVHFATGPRELWVAHRDGRPPVRVSRPRAGVVNASWSPDGRYLAYDEHTPDERFSVVARPDGSERLRLHGERWLPRWR